jgi:hypothetical protein
VKNQRKNQKTISKARFIRKNQKIKPTGAKPIRKNQKINSPEPVAGQTQTGRGFAVWGHSLPRSPPSSPLRRSPSSSSPAPPSSPSSNPSFGVFFLLRFFLLSFSYFSLIFFPHIIRWGWFYFGSMFHAEVANYEWPAQKIPFVQVEYISYSLHIVFLTSTTKM